LRRDEHLGIRHHDIVQVLPQYEEVRGVGVGVSLRDTTNAKLQCKTTVRLLQIPQYEEVKGVVQYDEEKEVGVGVGVSRRDKIFSITIFGLPISTTTTVSTVLTEYTHIGVSQRDRNGCYYSTGGEGIGVGVSRRDK